MGDQGGAATRQEIDGVVLIPLRCVLVGRTVLAALSVVAAIGLLFFFWTAAPFSFHAPNTEVAWWNIKNVRMMLGSHFLALLGLAAGIYIPSISRRARVRIGDGHITGYLLDLRDYDINIEIDDLYYIMIRRRLNGRIKALELIHCGGTDVLKGFKGLGEALEAILLYRPEGIEVSEKRWFSI